MNADGLRPLDLAVMRGSVEILKEFISFGNRMIFTLSTPAKETIFHLTARYKQTDAFIFMAEYVDKKVLL